MSWSMQAFEMTSLICSCRKLWEHPGVRVWAGDQEATCRYEFAMLQNLLFALGSS